MGRGLRLLGVSLLAALTGCAAEPDRTSTVVDSAMGASGGTGGTQMGTTSGAPNTTGGIASGGSTGAVTGGSTGMVTPPMPANPADTCAKGTEALAQGVRIREISLYQTIKIPLLQNGTWATSPVAPIVQGKKALIRVFFDTLPGYKSRPLLGVLTLDNGGGMPTYVKAELTPATNSSDPSLASTFNFTLEGTQIGASTKLSVALVDKTCPTAFGTAMDARYPSTGTQALATTNVGKLKVVVVPIQLSNGVIPDTSPAQLQKFKEEMLAYYPVPDVEVTADDVLTVNASVSAQGGGWSDVLNAVLNERRSDRPSREVYYFGIMNPATSFMGYCGFGCVLGLAPQTVYVSPDQQAGLGVGFIDPRSYGTMVHELGHAHGRGHAPCGGAQGIDRDFPYSDGSTSTWGWDARTNTLHTPTDKDIMGYCEPTWISDFTYKELAERSQQVNANARWSTGLIEETSWHGVLLYQDGQSRMSGAVTTELPGGDPQKVLVLDRDGEPLTETHVVRIKLSHLDDELLYIANLEDNWGAIQLDDRELRLDDVLPAL